MPERSLLQIILLNIYYIGVAIAFLIKDIFWLRIIMIFAGIAMIIQGFISQNSYIIMWMSLFTVINSLQVARILYENRKIKLPPDLMELYEQSFQDMSRKEFLMFWNMGTEKKAKAGSMICQDGVDQQEIILIIKGVVRIEKSGREIAILKRGYFTAEMSYLTGLPPSANVVALSEIKYITWDFNVLFRLKEVYPDTHNKLQLIISKDLTNKLKRYLN